MLTPVAIMVVNQLPEHTTGAIVNDVNEFIFDDAAQRGDKSPMDVAEKLIHQVLRRHYSQWQKKDVFQCKATK